MVPTRADIGRCPQYGFNAKFNLGYELIRAGEFRRYLNGYGEARLRQIKYKYFSDRDIALWDLCFAFFHKAHRANVASEGEGISHENFALPCGRRLCYNICAHLKVEGPKKPSRGTIGNDVDLLAGNLCWSLGDEGVNPRWPKGRRGRAKWTSGCHRERFLLKSGNAMPGGHYEESAILIAVTDAESDAEFEIIKFGSVPNTGVFMKGG